MKLSREYRPHIYSPETELSDQELLAALHTAEYVNKGQDAIVLKVKIPMLQMDGTEYIAAKLLKIYTDGREANYEARIQQHAYDIVESAAAEAPPGHRYARIPKPLGVRNIALDAGTKEAIQQMSAVSFSIDSVEIEFMEYITDSVELLDHIRNSAREVYLAAGKNYEIFNPGRPILRTDDQQERKRREYIDLYINGLHKLSTDDPVLNPDVLAQVQRTVALLHKHGIYHRDLHERNILVKADGQVYMIDFGKSVIIPTGSTTADVYQTEDGMYDDDLTIFYRYRRLTTTPSDEKEKEKKSVVTSIRSLRTRIESKKGIQALDSYVAAVYALCSTDQIEAIPVLMNRVTVEAKKVFGSQAGQDDLARMICVAICILQESYSLSLSQLQTIESLCVQSGYTPSILQSIYLLV